jgi:hypothetical protein
MANGHPTKECGATCIPIQCLYQPDPRGVSNKMISIIDYGAGNLRSVANAIAKLGYEPSQDMKNLDYGKHL